MQGQGTVPATLADFFFIAGLEGTESAILKSATLTGLKDTATALQEPILEEPSPTENKSHADTLPPGSVRSSVNETGFSDIASDSGTEVTSIIDDVMAKFSSERDEFLLTLAPPTVPVTSFKGGDEEDEDHVPELQHLSIGPSLRSRSSLRNRLTDSLRRTPTLRRAGTMGTSPLPPIPDSLRVELIVVSRRSSRRSSITYNAVIPTPDPLILPPGTHPLKRKLAPRLLGIWPTSQMTEYIKERGQPPDYLPMFAFPNDIQVKLSDERPRSTWHGFVFPRPSKTLISLFAVQGF